MKTFTDLIIPRAREQPDVVFKGRFEVKKTNKDKHIVFGWANVSTRVNGEQVEDWDDDMIDIDELEKAAYIYVENYRDGGEMHERGGVATLVESIVFTKEKMTQLGVPNGTLPEGWWVGFRVTDNDVWEKIKNGTYLMFSIEGDAVREEVE